MSRPHPANPAQVREAELRQLHNQQRAQLKAFLQLSAGNSKTISTEELKLREKFTDENLFVFAWFGVALRTRREDPVESKEGDNGGRRQGSRGAVPGLAGFPGKVAAECIPWLNVFASGRLGFGQDIPHGCGKAE